MGLVQAGLDAVVGLVAAFLVYEFRFHVYPSYIPGGEEPDPNHYLAAAPLLVLGTLSIFFLLGVYRQRRGLEFIDELLAVLWGMGGVALAGFAAIGLYREGVAGFTYSRLTFVYWLVAATIGILTARFLLRRYLVGRRARGLGAERAVVVGWGASADLLVQRIRMFPSYGYRLLGVLTDDMEPGSQVAGTKVLGRIADLERVAQGRDVDVVFIALPDVDQNETMRVVERCRGFDVDIRILPGIMQLMSGPVTADQIDGIPLIQIRRGLEIQGPKTTLKRGFDLCVAGLGLVLISPVLALLTLLVKLTSPGPVFIHQERVGMHGRPFQTHKFRSMRENAEDESGPVWATAEDPRRTAVGKWLRRFSLDELPQLWNIVAGEMSLVGPRAERPSFVCEFSERLPRYDDRHLVRPGLTGWAQANDLRGHTPVEERLIYDLYYIENWSLAFDVKIILLTLGRVWTHKNAY